VQFEILGRARRGAVDAGDRGLRQPAQGQDGGMKAVDQEPQQPRRIPRTGLDRAQFAPAEYTGPAALRTTARPRGSCPSSSSAWINSLQKAASTVLARDWAFMVNSAIAPALRRSSFVVIAISP
jgi:hypothetical protein